MRLSCWAKCSPEARLCSSSRHYCALLAEMLSFWLQSQTTEAQAGRFLSVRMPKVRFQGVSRPGSLPGSFLGKAKKVGFLQDPDQWLVKCLFTEPLALEVPVKPWTQVLPPLSSTWLCLPAGANTVPTPADLPRAECLTPGSLRRC